ncbi:general stress protein [Nonomuraea salmonea]|uniref:general stress protein n=1 Tax=Nonomuraea salmonea TaxID=46181 RepID=UPI0031E6DCB0
MSVAPSGPIMTKRELIGSYSSYEEAQKVVDHLSDHGFPVSGTLIVGSGLHSMERVLARMTHLRAAGWGAAGGAWFGVLIGLFLAIFSTTAAAGLPLVLWGGCCGVRWLERFFGVISHAMLRGQRDFISESALVADRYDVLVDSEHAAQAHELLRGMSR